MRQYVWEYCRTFSMLNFSIASCAIRSSASIHPFPQNLQALIESPKVSRASLTNFHSFLLHIFVLPRPKHVSSASSLDLIHGVVVPRLWTVRRLTMSADFICAVQSQHRGYTHAEMFFQNKGQSPTLELLFLLFRRHY